MSEKLSIEEMIKRKDEISLIVFDNNVFIPCKADGKQFTERDCAVALREYFVTLGFEVVDA